MFDKNYEPVGRKIHFYIFPGKYLVFSVYEVIRDPPTVCWSAPPPSYSIYTTVMMDSGQLDVSHLPDLPEYLLHHLRPAHAPADLHLEGVWLPLLNPFHHVGKVLDYLDQIN